MPRFIAITLLVLLAAFSTACSRDTESTVTSDTPRHRNDRDGHFRYDYRFYRRKREFDVSSR